MGHNLLKCTPLTSLTCDPLRCEHLNMWPSLKKYGQSWSAQVRGAPQGLCGPWAWCCAPLMYSMHRPITSGSSLLRHSRRMDCGGINPDALPSPDCSSVSDTGCSSFISILYCATLSTKWHGPTAACTGPGTVHCRRHFLVHVRPRDCHTTGL